MNSPYLVEHILEYLQPKKGYQFHNYEINSDTDDRWVINHKIDDYIFLNRNNALNEFKQYIIDQIELFNYDDYDDKLLQLQQDFNDSETDRWECIGQRDENGSMIWTSRVFEIQQVYVGQ